jgi:hypothetical protein
VRPRFSHQHVLGRAASSGLRTKSATTGSSSDSPDPISSRVGSVSAFPNEYPGQIYAFNWCLNGDGVTPLKKSAFRITKPLDLKVAGLQAPKKIPLMVRPGVFLYCALKRSASSGRLRGVGILLSRDSPFDSSFLLKGGPDSAVFDELVFQMFR